MSPREKYDALRLMIRENQNIRRIWLDDTVYAEIFQWVFVGGQAPTSVSGWMLMNCAVRARRARG